MDPIGPASLGKYPPAHVGAAAALPWLLSARPGTSSKLLRVMRDDRGFVELLRLEPGTIMPLHRHTGEVHAYNISGSRELCSGEIIGPGDYVYEPAGNTDWWKAVGDEPMVAFVIVLGEVEFLAPGGVVISRASAATLRADYEEYCRARGMAIVDVTERGPMQPSSQGRVCR